MDLVARHEVYPRGGSTARKKPRIGPGASRIQVRPYNLEVHDLRIWTGEY